MAEVGLQKNNLADKFALLRELDARFGSARFLQSDARGSIVYSSNYQDGARVVNTYDGSAAERA